MSASAQFLRLHILLEPPAVIRVLDRLAVLGIAPHRMAFRQTAAGDGILLLQLTGVSEPCGESLVLRLEQIPAVQAVKVQKS